MRLKHRILLGAALVFLGVGVTRAEVKVVVDHNTDSATPAFKFKNVPSPAKRSAATGATFSIVDGRRDQNGAGISALNDGKLPSESDDAGSNFFFNAGTRGGRIEADLGNVIEVKQIDTYSWHGGTRGPQVYSVYGSDGSSSNFVAKPKIGTEPTSVGWKLIGKVDTRPKSGEIGGQYGVSISDSAGNLGKFRYLLFDVSQTETDDAFGNTFYSEISIIDASATPVAAAEKPAEVVAPMVFHAHNPDCEITIDTSGAPELKEWVETKLGPTLAEWYPKIVAMLPSDDYIPPKAFSVTIRPGNGVAATGGTRVTANSRWLDTQLNGEAVGALVHEEVHVVQQYGYGLGGGRRGSTTRPANATGAGPTTRRVGNPVWLVEGIADYVRWWFYEPDGPRRYVRSGPRARYDGSYTTSANFLMWVSQKYDKDIVKQMNAAMRERRYNPDLWKQYTGKDVETLGAEWKETLPATIPGQRGGATTRPAGR
jgi:hypothetical protein